MDLLLTFSFRFYFVFKYFLHSSIHFRNFFYIRFLCFFHTKSYLASVFFFSYMRILCMYLRLTLSRLKFEIYIRCLKFFTKFFLRSMQLLKFIKTKINKKKNERKNRLTVNQSKNHLSNNKRLNFPFVC